MHREREKLGKLPRTMEIEHKYLISRKLMVKVDRLFVMTFSLLLLNFKRFSRRNENLCLIYFSFIQLKGAQCLPVDEVRGTRMGNVFQNIGKYWYLRILMLAKNRPVRLMGT